MGLRGGCTFSSLACFCPPTEVMLAGGISCWSSESQQRAMCLSCLGSTATPSDVGSGAPGGRMVIMRGCTKRL